MCLPVHLTKRFWKTRALCFRGRHFVLPRALLHSDGVDRPAGRHRSHGGVRRRVRSERRPAEGDVGDDAGERRESTHIMCVQINL